MIDLYAEQIVEGVTEKIYEKDPELLERYGEKGKIKCKEDNHHHLKHLKTAFELNDPKIFTDYAVWLDGILKKHGMQTHHLIDNFIIIEEVLMEIELENKELVLSYLSYLKSGKEALSNQEL